MPELAARPVTRSDKIAELRAEVRSRELAISRQPPPNRAIYAHALRGIAVMRSILTDYEGHGDG